MRKANEGDDLVEDMSTRRHDHHTNRQMIQKDVQPTFAEHQIELSSEGEDGKYNMEDEDDDGPKNDKFGDSSFKD